MKPEFNKEMTLYQSLIDNYIRGRIQLYNDGYDVVKEAMLYSLFAGGKRIRPILTLEFCKANGGDINKALPLACAVEMIHCYSLIHDDLPCMDDDDMRRGRPSCHKAYGEEYALLAGDALLTLAFETIASADIDDSSKAAACLSLAKYAGVDGMVGGQVIDLKSENKKVDEDTLKKMYLLKTSALIKTAIELGMIAAKAETDKTQAALKYAENLGLAFQIIDDILDVTGDEVVLGKPIGSDEENNKTTFVTIYGVKKASEIAKELTNNALYYLNESADSEFLREFTDMLLKRDH